ncbi:MAG TPA: DNA polymerase III subunit beta [Solirubrobacteraceae bacterium]|jgi:DNA polymerase-3 subunit beta|nr:DNA polymerase III subunit beta [Solirubrobacteraceae bacterium]
MKISLQTSELLTQLQTVTRVASTRSAVQALSGVMIIAGDDGAELQATDMEVGLRLPLQAQTARPGRALLPGRLLLDVVRALPAQELSLELRPSEQDVELLCGGATFHLRTLRAEDFPSLPTAGEEGRMMLPADAFVQTVERVARSASHDETRPVLTGILISAADRELRMVATDSYRLGVKRTVLETPLQGSIEANVPARALQELSRVAQQYQCTEVTLGVGQNQVIFELGGVVLSSRLIDGQFPNYRQLIPESADHELTLATVELAGVVRRISLLAQKNAPLRLAFREGELTVSAQTPDVGEASETIPVPFHGESFEIGFNPEFLRDGVESIDTEELVMKLISPLRPGLIESPEAGDFVYLVMPIRLNT